MINVKDLEMGWGVVILAYPDVPNIITEVLKSGRGSQKIGSEKDDKNSTMLLDLKM